MLRRLILIVLGVVLVAAPAAPAETTTRAVKRAYQEVLVAVDAVYNAHGQAELAAAAAKLDKTCARALKQVSRTKPRSLRERRARRRAMKGLREGLQAAKLLARAARFPDGQEQFNLVTAGHKALQRATDDLDAAVKGR